MAIVTALSGYQAALWDGESAKEYATSSRLRTEANGTQLTANQTLIYNAGNFTAWLQAYDAGDKSLQKLLERRFTPEYKKALRRVGRDRRDERPERARRARATCRSTRTRWSRRRRS